MGPNFHLGVTSIGRERLPPNHVAILDDPALLCAAMRELHAYALSPSNGASKTRYAIVFRLVGDAELRGLHHKMITLLDPARFMENSAAYRLKLGSWHVIDSEHMTHVCNRHADDQRERSLGHVGVKHLDFERIPDVTAPSNIVEFAEANGGTPRLVYRKRYADGELTVIQEVRVKGFAVKTMYKKK